MEKKFIEKYYTIKDLDYRKPVEIEFFDDIFTALEDYKKLPSDKVKAFGIYQMPNPLPGCFDFIQHINGKDKMIYDYVGHEDWENEEIEEALKIIKKFLSLDLEKA